MAARPPLMRYPYRPATGERGNMKYQQLTAGQRYPAAIPEWRAVWSA